MADIQVTPARRSGTFVSDSIESIALPRLEFICTIPGPDLRNSSISVLMILEISRDSEVTWETWTSTEWFGRAEFTNGFKPQRWGPAPPPGLRARVRLEMPEEVNVGVTVDWLAEP